MTRTALISSLRFATLTVALALVAGCATSQPTSQADKLRSTTAERVADRNDSRFERRSH